MDGADQRAALEALIRARGEDYSSLSRLIGRNAAYIQQFVKRGTPRKLDEADRRTLAAYFGVPDSALGGRDDAAPDLVLVRRLDVGASAGPGAAAAAEAALPRLGFEAGWLRGLGASVRPQALSMIRVQGDSMAPTLADGDEIMVDGDDGAARLRDGIYVLRVEDVLIVKRLVRHPAGGFRVRSDNRDYPDWADYDPARMTVIGRVVWAGRRLG